MILMSDQEQKRVDCLSDRLNYALSILNITQADLAKRLNVKPQIINYLCKSKTKTSKLTYVIADALNISGEWLASGVGHMDPEDNPTFKIITNQNKVPVLPLSEIKQHAINGVFDENIQADLYLLTTAITGSHGFATRLDDSSMHPRFNKDTLLIINTNKKPQNKEFVIAYIHAIDDIIFRQLEFTHEGIILKPINNELYKYVKLKDNDKIIGTLVEARWQF